MLDHDALSEALAAFARAGHGLGPARGVVAIDGKPVRGGYERGRAHRPPLLVGVWDAETGQSITARAASDGNAVAATLAVLKTLI